MPRLFRAGTRVDLPPPPDDFCAQERKPGCVRALRCHKLSRRGRTQGELGTCEPSDRWTRVEAERSELRRKPSDHRCEGQEGPPGLARSRPRTQPRSAGPKSPAWQGLQRKVGTRDQALRGLTPSLVVRTPPFPVSRALGQTPSPPGALTGSPAEKWEP